MKITLKNVGCFTHSRHLTTLSINHSASSRNRTTKRNTVDFIWHLSLREGIPENILAFKIALKLKTAFNRKNTMRLWIRHVGGRTVSKPLPSLRQVTWPVFAPYTVLHSHTNIFTQQFNFIALIPSQYSISKVVLRDSSITLYEPRKRHLFVKQINT